MQVPNSQELVARLKNYETRAKKNDSLFWIEKQIKKGLLKDNKKNSLIHICQQDKIM